MTKKPRLDELKNRNYPDLICHDCGKKYGRMLCGIASWHIGTCGVCGKETSVTEPRDYGYLNEGWNNAQNRAILNSQIANAI